MGPENVEIKTTEMHTGGDPLRIIESGYPDIKGNTLTEKIRYVKERFDNFRTFVMMEPRGHFNMYGAVLVKPTVSEADIAVLFIQISGYSSMCGHGVIALARYAVDKGIVAKPSSPEAVVNIQCPCGVVKCFVEYNEGKTGMVRFHSVPAYVFALDKKVDVAGIGTVAVDISYGGAFYAIISANALQLDLENTSESCLFEVAAKITDAVRKTIKFHHPDDADLAYIYGTIITDGEDQFMDKPTSSICVYGDRQVCRAPCGSGVTARIAMQYHKGQIKSGQQRTFQSATTGSQFTAKVIEEIQYGGYKAVKVEVSGEAYYTGSATFVVEKNDPFKQGFLVD